MKNIYFWRQCKNKLMLGLITLPSFLIFIPLLLIFFFLIKNGIESLSLDFIINTPKPVGEVGGGMLHAILGSFYMLAIGGTIGVFWGMGAGIYLSEYGRGTFASVLRFSTDLLSGTPSIVVGLFVYALLVVPFKGFSALAGSFALSLIVLPIVVKTTEEILKLLPMDIREAGLALGIPRYKVILHIVVWGNRSSLLTGILLAISRAAGETAPLLFTAFGSLYLSYSPTSPMAALPLQIYNYAISPYEDWQNQAWTGALILVTLILFFNLSARLIANWDKIKAIRRS
jgi:phosphate transport system permease protein